MPASGAPEEWWFVVEGLVRLPEIIGTLLPGDGHNPFAASEGSGDGIDHRTPDSLIGKFYYWAIYPVLGSLVAYILMASSTVAEVVLPFFFALLLLRTVSSVIESGAVGFTNPMQIVFRSTIQAVLVVSALFAWDRIVTLYLSANKNISAGIVAAVNPSLLEKMPAVDFSTARDLHQAGMSFGSHITNQSVLYLTTGTTHLQVLRRAEAVAKDAKLIVENDPERTRRNMDMLMDCIGADLREIEGAYRLEMLANRLERSVRNLIIKSREDDDAQKIAEGEVCVTYGSPAGRAAYEHLLREVKAAKLASVTPMVSQFSSMTYTVVGFALSFILMIPFFNYYVANMVCALFMLIIIPFAMCFVPFNTEYLRNCLNNFIALTVQASVAAVFYILVWGGILTNEAQKLFGGDPTSTVLILIVMVALLYFVLPRAMTAATEIFGGGLEIFAGRVVSAGGPMSKLLAMIRQGPQRGQPMTATATGLPRRSAGGPPPATLRGNA